MNMKWIALGLMLPSIASARGFRMADLPHTTTFSYAWASVPVSGDTEFTFDNGTATQVGDVVCDATTGCMTGEFSTGNLGTGEFETRAYSTSFNFVAGSTFTFRGTDGQGNRYFTRPVVSDLEQGLRLLYDITAATYSGTTYCGTVEHRAIFVDAVPPGGGLDYLGSDQFNYNFEHNPFEGELGGPGTGTFVEL